MSGFLDPRVSPANLDSLTAGKATQPGSALNTALSATTATAIESSEYLPITFEMRGEKARNVKDAGAVGDGVADDTAALQSVIDASAAETRATSMGIRGVVEIPAGKYKISSTITQPPYVKVVTQGAVLIESYVPAGAAWHITPLAADPSNLYAPLKKQQWLRGFLIDASKGGLTFINRTGAYGSTVGLELGSRTNLGHQMARYALGDISAQDYQTGMKFNTYNHYIAWYYRMHLEQNVVNVQIGTTAINNSNSGENINFIDSVIGTNAGDVTGAGIIFDAFAIDVTLRGCSLDFLNTVARFNKGWNRLLIDGGHMEGINEGGRRNATGGIAVSSVAAPDVLPDLVIKGMTPLVQKDRGVLFRGNMRLWVEMEYRNNGGFATFMGAEDNWLCEDTVVVRNMSITTPSGGPNVSRTVNGVIDPNFAAEADGTAVASLANYTVASVSNCVATVSPDGPRVGAKAIKALITGSGFLRLAPKTYIPCRPGETMAASMTYKFAATPYPTLAIYGSFYNSEKALIKSTQTQINRTTTEAAAWRMHDGPILFQAPPGAVYFRPEFQISSSAGVGTNELLISDFSGYKV